MGATGSTATLDVVQVVVEALEIGRPGKTDAVADELCSTFGVDLASLIGTAERPDDPEVARRREAVVAALVAAVPSPEDLIVELVRIGGDLVAMVDEIYRLLAEHRATTSAQAQATLRLTADDLDITISPAFIRRAQALVSAVRDVVIGDIRVDLLARFLGFDNGGVYGSFPLDDGDGRRLAHEVLAVGVLGRQLDDVVSGDVGFEVVRPHLASAEQATGELLDRLDRLVRAWVAGLGAPAAVPLGAVVEAGLYVEVEAPETFALRVDPSALVDRSALPVVRSTVAVADEPRDDDRLDDDWRDDDRPDPDRPDPDPDRADPDADADAGVDVPEAIRSLAAYLAIARRRLTPRDVATPGALGPLVAPTPDGAIAWLDGITTAAREAREWIDREVWIVRSTQRMAGRALEDLLDLPLWRERPKLYEVWALTATIAAAADAGWQVDLLGISADGAVWPLPSAPAPGPVAHLTRGGWQAEVWREPERIDADGALTPDVTISTPGPDRRELALVEVKDRVGFKTGAAGGLPKPETALGTALKYVPRLRPLVTWVLGLCPLAGHQVAPEENVGSRWHPIHLAGDVRPGHVPARFGSSIALALAPPRAAVHAHPADAVPLDLVVVLDTTGSMHGHIPAVIHAVGGLPDRPGGACSAVIVGDHDIELLTMPLGPVADPASLAGLLALAPRTFDGDAPEALEDALVHCRWVAETSGPIDVVVFTDARPHTEAECPAEIDFDTEAAGLLATGSRLLVVSDWLGPPVRRSYRSCPHVELVALADLGDALATPRSGR